MMSEARTSGALNRCHLSSASSIPVILQSFQPTVLSLLQRLLLILRVINPFTLTPSPLLSLFLLASPHPRFFPLSFPILPIKLQVIRLGGVIGLVRLENMDGHLELFLSMSEDDI